MSQISSLCRSIPLIAIVASCAGSAPEPKTSAPPESSPPAGGVFRSAIAVRDESVTAFFGRLAPGKRAPPSTLSIAFYDSAEVEVERLSNLEVQVSSSGLVYAAPSKALPTKRQQNIQKAAGAKVDAGSVLVPIYLGQAVGSISRFRDGYWDPKVASVHGGGCPDCLQYFLCCCMEKRYGFTVDREALGCSSFGACSRPCEEFSKLEPTPW
jgi:hypothetical protein